ncbi:MAG: recombination protein RecR [Candidatus Doudnabacteria bacterium]|nr:recombination protein RecR [Candidatus Doudnabacteria bacterium]
MHILPRSIEKVIEELSKLPGIGPKSASRLTFYLYKLPSSQYQLFVDAITHLRTNVTSCEVCFNMAESSVCAICGDDKRKPALICAVEDPLDVLALEQTKKYDGVYHVLGGAISPIDGIGPEQLKIEELVERVKKLKKQNKEVEVILATNPSLEGDATSMYIAKQLKPLDVRITKLARGIPVGGDLEYTDELTLSDAINFRKEI